MAISDHSTTPSPHAYWPLGIVGHGRFGRVYCAIHRQTGHLVALKQLNPQNIQVRPQLLELRQGIGFQHPNVVACSAIEPTTSGQQLVLEYCEGGTLRNLMASPVRLSRADIIPLIGDVLAGLAYVHQQGIIHCDIKPENILLSDRGDRWVAKLSDFGLARLAQVQEPKQLGQTGSPAYMAPERFYRQVSAASDLYSVGILLYELWVGHRPFTGDADQLRRAHLNQPVPLPDNLPDSIRTILQTVLQKRPGCRYDSAEAMRKALLGLDLPAQAQSKLRLLKADLNPFCQLTTPAQALAPLSISSDPAAEGLLGISQQRLWICQVSKSPMSATGWTLLTTLPEPIQALQQVPQGWCIVTARSLHVVPEPQLNPVQIAKFDEPHQVAIAPGGRWFAALAGLELQIGRLFDPQAQISAFTGRRFQRSVPIQMERIQQAIGIDSRHFLAISYWDEQTRLQLFTRRGQYLGEHQLPFLLRQLTPTAVPDRWLGLDVAAPESAVLIDFKPYRLIRLQLAITPQFTTALPWGYGFTDVQGRMQLLDRDFCPVGAIQLPEGPTAIATASNHEIWVATWSQGQGSLYNIDLRQLDLNLVL